MRKKTNGGTAVLTEEPAPQKDMSQQAENAAGPAQGGKAVLEGDAPEVRKPPKRRGVFRHNTAKTGAGRQRAVRREKDQIIRIEQLQAALAAEGSEVDPEAIVSLYLPHRKVRRLAAALLQVGKMQLALLAMILAVAILFIMAFMQEKMGNFTINLNRLELFRHGISIAADEDFTNPTARLTADTVQDATNISLEDIPSDIDEIDGNHNGKNYMAYTYYVRNAGKEDLGYIASIRLEGASKGAQDAVRVAVYHNGERTVYAAPAANGGDEAGCTSFANDNMVCQYTEENFQVGDVDKYTIVIWMDGNDPQCNDAIVGGSVQFGMNIDSEYHDNTNLLVKFIQDIRDTLTGNHPIDAAGTNAPDYYSESEITYENRRNQ